MPAKINGGSRDGINAIRYISTNPWPIFRPTDAKKNTPPIQIAEPISQGIRRLGGAAACVAGKCGREGAGKLPFTWHPAPDRGCTCGSGFLCAVFASLIVFPHAKECNAMIGALRLRFLVEKKTDGPHLSCRDDQSPATPATSSWWSFF